MANDFTADLTTAFQLDPARDIRNVHGAPGWFELVTPDPGKAAEYLGQLFGWGFRAIQVAGADYQVILVRGHEVGGVRRPMPGEPTDPRWDTYVTVADVDQLADQAAAAGAEPGRLADFTVAAVQGAMLLGLLDRGPGPARAAVEEACAHLVGQRAQERDHARP
jgi:predicted enzyme related to lactoylglutathione lyase